jgi:thioredoxin 1
MGERTFDVTTSTFDDEVLKSEVPVLVDFWAEWCGPCRMIAPLVDQLADKYQGKMLVGKLDTDANQEIVMRFGIMGIPTLILFKNGEVAERITGYMPINVLEPRIAQHLD